MHCDNSLRRVASGGSFDEDEYDLIDLEDDGSDALCVVNNQSGSRVGVGHAGGFKVFEVRKVVLREDIARSAAAPRYAIPPFQLVELFHFDGFLPTSRVACSNVNVHAKGKGIGQIALLFDTMQVAAVGGGLNPAAAPNVVLVFLKSTLESVVEYPAPVSRLMIAQDMLFTLTTDRFFSIRSFAGVPLMRVATHTMNTSAEQPLAVELYRKLVAYPDSRDGSFSVANFADPNNIRVVCSKCPAHRHALTALSLGQATVPVATVASTNGGVDGSASGGTAAQPNGPDAETYEATVCITSSLNGTLIRVWDVTDDLASSPNPLFGEGMAALSGKGKMAGIPILELRVSPASCHIRHLGLNKRNYMYALIGNELKIFYIGGTAKTPNKNYSVVTRDTKGGANVTNRESLLKKLNFVSSYFASQWAACAVGLPSKGLFLPLWAPRGSVDCLRLLGLYEARAKRELQKRQHSRGGSDDKDGGVRRDGNRSPLPDDDYDDSTSSSLNWGGGATGVIASYPQIVSRVIKEAYINWVPPEQSEAARELVQQSSTAVFAAISKVLRYATHTTNEAFWGAMESEFMHSALMGTLPPPPSEDEEPATTTHREDSHELDDTTHTSTTSGDNEGEGKKSSLRLADMKLTWVKPSALQTMWSSYANAREQQQQQQQLEQQQQLDKQTGGAVPFPSIPGVYYDPNMSGKQLDDLVGVWWENRDSLAVRRIVEWDEHDVEEYERFQARQNEELRSVYVAQKGWTVIDATEASEGRNGRGGATTGDLPPSPLVDDDEEDEDVSQDLSESERPNDIGDKELAALARAHPPIFADSAVLYDNSKTVPKKPKQPPPPPSAAAARSSAAFSSSPLRQDTGTDYIWSANAQGELVRVGFTPVGGQLVVYRVVPPKLQPKKSEG